MPYPTALGLLLFAAALTVAPARPGLAQEEENTRGVRILDEARPGAATPAERPQSAPSVAPPPASATPSPTLRPPSATPSSPPAARLTPTPAVPTLTAPPAAPPLTAPAPAVPTLTTPAPQPIAPAPELSRPAAEPTPPTPSTTPAYRPPAEASFTPPPAIPAPAPRTELPVGPIQGQNSAGVSIDILPGQELQLGQRITLRVSTKRPGYLVIVDIDASGKVTQIYPNVRSLMLTKRERETANLIKPGGAVRIPNPLNAFAGFELVASPPKGVAMVLAMLSERPVQVVDLPNVPDTMAGRKSAFTFLQDVARRLRIAAAKGPSSLQRARWSFDAKFYVIR